MMDEVGGAIGVLTSILCAVLLVRAYRKERTPLSASPSSQFPSFWVCARASEARAVRD
jgi:hypothetical protein